MPAFDDNSKDRDIRRIDAWDTSRLRQCFGTELFEFFTAFKAHGRTGIIVKPCRYPDGLVLFGTSGGYLLLANVPGVMMSDPELFDNRQKIVWLELVIRVSEFCMHIRMFFDKCTYLVKRLA